MNKNKLTLNPAITFQVNDINLLQISREKYDTKPTKSPSNSTITNTTCNDEASLPSMPIEKVPTVFEWIGKSESVYLTGSFCNWKHKLKMTLLQNSSRLVLGLPRGKYQYKFIVNGEWAYSKNHPVLVQQGITNNVIDNTAYRSKPNAECASGDTAQERTPRRDAEERTFVPIPDIFAQPFSLEVSNKPLPNVFFNHTSICLGATKQSNRVELMTTQRVREKTVIVKYYKPKT